jgi:hypothetical protein
MRLVADLKSVAEFGLAPHNEAVVSQSARALGSDTSSIVEASLFCDRWKERRLIVLANRIADLCDCHSVATALMVFCYGFRRN